MTITPCELPHSGTHGSTPADGSPWLFAAFHALLRLVTPRHPPCAFPSSATALTHDAEPTGSTLLFTTLLLSMFVTTVGRHSDESPERRPTKTARRLSDRHRSKTRDQKPRSEASGSSLCAMTVKIVVTPAP